MASKLNFRRSVTGENPLSAEELRAAEQTLARLVAAAYAADHPETFGNERGNALILGSRPETPSPRFSGPENQGITTAGEIHAPIE